jgi:hypothetical protein
MRKPSKLARLQAILGVLAAAIVPLTLLMTWGHLSQDVGYASSHTVVTSFNGSVLSRSIEIALIAISCAVVALGVIAVFRTIHPAFLALCAAAMAAELGLILIRLDQPGLFSYLHANPNVVNFHWKFGPVSIAAETVSAIGLAAWLGLLLTAVIRARTCPDCAERIPRSAIDCPHCGFKLLLPGGLRRCVSRPVEN